MYRPDIISLREFYSTSLGECVARMLRDAVRTQWPEINQDTLLGIGYTLPLLPIWKQSKRQEPHISTGCFSLMPANLGAVYWPTRGKNKSAMVWPEQLPIRDAHCNRILMLHGLEHADSAAMLLKECWRALVPGGRMLICVPNRLGFWSRRETSPFASGHPYSMNELKQLLAEHQFTFKKGQTLLNFPPAKRRWIIKLMPWLETALSYLFPLFGGIVMIEVEKQIYASSTQKRHSLKPVRAFIPSPSATAQKR